jgi:hypothetical protein
MSTPRFSFALSLSGPWARWFAHLKRLALLGAQGSILATAAHAHTVWIELNGSGHPVVRFAEPGEPFETSPGHLDGLTPPLAIRDSDEATITVAAVKQHESFLLSGVTENDRLAVESIFTVRGDRKPCFYARWQPRGNAPKGPRLTLDLVPTERPGAVRAYFRNRPLGNVPAQLRLPNGVPLELWADPDGFIRFEPQGPGQYLLTIAHHRETRSGFHRGQAYERVSHNAALTWIQP